jgi:hypothetical protein
MVKHIADLAPYRVFRDTQTPHNLHKFRYNGED